MTEGVSPQGIHPAELASNPASRTLRSAGRHRFRCGPERLRHGRRPRPAISLRTSPAPSNTPTPPNLADHRRQHHAVRHRILRRQNPRLRSTLERAPHLRSRPHRRPAHLPRHRATHSRRTTARHTSRSGHRSRRPLRQDRHPRRRYAIPRAFLEHLPQPRRGRPRHLPNLARHPPPLRCWRHRARPSADRRGARAFCDAGPPRVISRSRKRAGWVAGIDESRLADGASFWR